MAAELDSLGLLVTPERPTPANLEYADLSKLTYLSAAIKVRCWHSHYVCHHAHLPLITCIAV